MSAARFLAAATVVLVAVLLAPAALVPGFNGADLVVISAPIVLLLICARPKHTEPPAGGASSPADEPPAGRQQ
jgi:peptidoglycan/LPS O-acetylase OafA/YrhL